MPTAVQSLERKVGKQKTLTDAVQELLSNSQPTGVLRTLFESLIPNTAPQGLLWRKLTPSHPDLVQWGFRNSRSYDLFIWAFFFISRFWCIRLLKTDTHWCLDSVALSWICIMSLFLYKGIYWSFPYNKQLIRGSYFLFFNIRGATTTYQLQQLTHEDRLNSIPVFFWCHYFYVR